VTALFTLPSDAQVGVRILLTVRHTLRPAIYVTVVGKVNRANVLFRQTDNINTELVVLREETEIGNVAEQSLLSFLSLHFNITKNVRMTNIA
jgi:hypothetical protein